MTIQLTPTIIADIETRTGKPVIVSKTGVAKGWGSMPYKSVVKLTKAEREAIKNNTHIVLVEGCRPVVNGISGETYRQAIYNIKFTHRMI